MESGFNGFEILGVSGEDFFEDLGEVLEKVEATLAVSAEQRGNLNGIGSALGHPQFVVLGSITRKDLGTGTLFEPLSKSISITSFEESDRFVLI
jgi:hypothetical protein